MVEFAFHPELFEIRAEVMDLLARNGFVWLVDFTAIDILHEVFGLEILGIREDEAAERILALLRQRFPGWAYGYLSLRDHVTRDPGWKVVFHREPEDDRGGWQPA